MTTPKALRHYCNTARPLMRQFMTPNSCIGATKLSLECLKLMGIEAGPLPTKLVVRVPSLRLAYTSGCTKEELPTENARQVLSWDGWNGHLVALVEKHWLLDATLDQADVASEGKIPIPSKVYLFEVPTTDDKLRAEKLAFHVCYSVVLDNGLEVTLEYMATDDHGYLKTNAWNDEALHSLAHDVMVAERGSETQLSSAV